MELNGLLNSNLIEYDGILYSNRASSISYPEEGNENCFQLEDNSFWFKHRNNCIIAAVKKYSPDKLFFDIGGGNGFVAKGLQDEGIETVLIEPGKKGCYNAKKRGLKNIICSTLEDASLEENSFTSIGLFDVLEHIENDQLFLEEIHTNLMPEGFLYMTVPAYSFLWSKEDDNAGHFKRYTRKRLQKLLQNKGFEIIYSTYIFSILPLPILLTRTLRYKLGFAKKKEDLSSHTKEHQQKNGFVSAILNKIWHYEQNCIKSGKSIAFGGSCFIVAKKH